MFTQADLDNATDPQAIIDDPTWTTADLADMALTWTERGGDRPLHAAVGADAEAAHAYYAELAATDPAHLRQEAAEALSLGRWTPGTIFTEQARREQEAGHEHRFTDAVCWAWACITHYEHADRAPGLAYAEALFGYARRTGLDYGELNERADAAARRFIVAQPA